MFFRSRRKKGQKGLWGYPPQIMDDEKESFWLQTCKICKTCFKICKIFVDGHFELACLWGNPYLRSINNYYH